MNRGAPFFKRAPDASGPGQGCILNPSQKRGAAARSGEGPCPASLLALRWFVDCLASYILQQHLNPLGPRLWWRLIRILLSPLECPYQDYPAWQPLFGRTFFQLGE